MAAPTTTGLVIEIGLKSIRLRLGDLPELVQERPELSDGERASWSLDWDQVMASDLPVLERAYRAKEMTPEQEACYRGLLRDLKEALPLIERRGLYPPPVPLDEAKI